MLVLKPAPREPVNILDRKDRLVDVAWRSALDELTEWMLGLTGWSPYEKIPS